MLIPNTSVCIRCGKQRVVVSVKEEIINGGVVTSTETACPDPDCQKKVNVLLAHEEEKRHQSFLLKQERLAPRKAN